MATILIVDDEYITHRIINVILGCEQYHILSAYNGLEALRLLDEHPVDLILTDIHMPFMDGLSLIEHLRAGERYRDLPIVIISASPRTETSIEALEKGATAYISQPFSSWELSRVVTDSLSEYSRPQVVRRAASFPSIVEK